MPLITFHQITTVINMIFLDKKSAHDSPAAARDTKIVRPHVLILSHCSALYWSFFLLRKSWRNNEKQILICSKNDSCKFWKCIETAPWIPWHITYFTQMSFCFLFPIAFVVRSWSSSYRPLFFSLRKVLVKVDIIVRFLLVFKNS